jgi:hypothetical protein
MGIAQARLGVVLLLATLAAAQTHSDTSEPKLPVTEEQSCLVNGRTDWPIESGSPIYSSWRSQRTQLGRLREGEKVTVLGGITITRQPDKLAVTKPKPDIGVKPCDVILRYDTFGEGNANIWANGVWHKGYKLWTAVETDGTGCRAIDACDSKVVENGIMERWVQVKNVTGITGWVLESKLTHGVYRDSHVFGELCAG